MNSRRCAYTSLRWSFITSSYFSTFLRMSKLRASTFFCAFSSALLIQGWTIASPSFRPSRVQHPAHPVGAEDPHQVVFERQEEARRARIALPARAAAQLVVDAPALVPLGADDEQARRRPSRAHAPRRPRRGSPPRASRARRDRRCCAASGFSRMSTLPPSLMSVPRPAMLVAIVTVPGAPAWAMIVRFLLVEARVQHRVRDLLAASACR